MNKMRYILCGILVVLCTCGLMFSGCGNDIDKLSVKLSSTAFESQSEGGEYNLTLIKEESDSDESWSATVTAKVEGLSNSMSPEIRWSWKSQYVDVTVSDNGATAVIKGVTSTSEPTEVVAYSVENRKAEAVIKVTNIVKPKYIESSKYQNGKLGIPLKTEFSVTPGELFNFYPEDSTIPEYEYTINNQTFNANESFVMTGSDGYYSLVASPKNKGDYTEEQLKSLTYTIELVRAYTPLSHENLKLTLPNESDDVKAVTLVKNSSAEKNKVVLDISPKNAINYTISSPNNIVYNEKANEHNQQVNKRGSLRISYDEKNMQFTLVGIEALEEPSQVDITFSVPGIDNSLTLTKSFTVQIVDYPTAILVNGVTGSDYSLSVYNKYASGEQGEKFRLNVVPKSNIFTDIVLKVGNDLTSLRLKEYLQVNGKAVFKNASEIEISSGDELYLTNNGGEGEITLIAYAKATQNSPDEVSRTIKIKLEKSIESLSVNDSYFDTDSKQFILEINEYGTSDYTSRNMLVGIYPSTASFETVTVSSSNTAIFDVSIDDYLNHKLLLTAKGIGTATLNIVAKSGATLTKTVRVVSRFNTATIDLDPYMSSAMYGANLTEYAEVEIGPNKKVKTLKSAYIARTGSGDSVKLVNTFYPQSAVDSGMISSVSFESSNSDAGYLSNSRLSLYNNLLTTLQTKDVIFNMKVTYCVLNGSNLEERTEVLKNSFEISIFERITSISVSESSIELLASVQGISIGSTTGSQTGSVYDDESTKKTLQVTVSPAGTKISSDNAIWVVEGNTSKVSIDKTLGESTTVSSKPLSNNDIRVSANVVVTVTDINGVTFVEKVKVIVNKIQQITDVYIKNYEASLKNNSLYFEQYKQETFDLDVSVAPANATNKNLEYIIFDAEKLEKREDGQDIVRMVSSNGKYSYYRILERTSSDPLDYPNQYTCKTAQLLFDEGSGNYKIKPKQAGYAFVYIIPQDVAQTKIDDTITKLPTQLKNITDISTIKRLAITVADGEKVPYQLYTPEDVASIRQTADGLTKNYHVMNTIDMSPYINKQLSANKNWTWPAIGNDTNPFSGSIQSYADSEEGATQSIVGWTLTRNYNNYVTGSPDNFRDYGIFGVVTGTISNVNFYFKQYNINQSVWGTGTTDLATNYNYGLVVGKLASKLVTDSNTKETTTKSGQITNVTVICDNLTFNSSASKNYQNKNGVSANIGVVGTIEAGASAYKISSTILGANIYSDDLIVNFGGIAGRNLGALGKAETDNVYNDFTSVEAEFNVGYKTSKTTKSAFGGAVGLNFGVVKNISTMGNFSVIKSSVENANVSVVGGVVGSNVGKGTDTGIIENVLSAVKIKSVLTNGIQGGVVGSSNGGSIFLAYYDIYENTTSTSGEMDSIGIKASGYSGGIAGQIEDTVIMYAIVQSYDLSTGVYNLVNLSGAMGGLVGYANGGSISKSFVHAGLKAESGTIAGILGEEKGTVLIENVYARGTLATESGANSYAYAGAVSGSLTIKYAYVDLGNDDLSVSSGAVTSTTIYVVKSSGDKTTNNVITYISQDNFLKEAIASLGFDATIWGGNGNLGNDINDGFPYLLRNGSAFVRLVPNKITVSANDFETINEDGNINSEINISGDTKKLILMYQKEKIYKLSDLFSMVTDPEIAIENVNLNIVITNTSVLQPLSTNNFTTAQLSIIGTGTAYIRISSKQNAGAYDAIQICVVNGFDNVKLFNKDDADTTKNINMLEQDESGDYFLLKIKHSGSTTIYAKYYQGDDEVTGVAGGIKFITGLKLENGELVSAVDENNHLVTNYNISNYGWQTESENKYLYYYVSNNDKLALTAYGDDKDTKLVTVIVPYFNVQFYGCDDKKYATTLDSSYQYDITDLSAKLRFETQIYYGVSDIRMGRVASETRIESSKKLEASVTIINDAYVDTMELTDLAYFVLYEVYDGNYTEVVYYDKTLKTPSLLSDKIYFNWEKDSFDSDTSALTIKFSVELSQTMRKSLKTEQDYRLVFGALDENGNKIEKTVTLDWTFIPQEVTNVLITHYSDAINNGARLTQAGATPSNAIVAGEYGLMKISISPDYANFDSIEVTSSIVNEQPLAFDQRVLDVQKDSSTKEDIYTYVTWQKGVGVIDNGISLYRASLTNGEFDGNFYVRTICFSKIPTGAKYTVTVKIILNGVVKEWNQDFTVYQTDTLSIAGEYEYELNGETRYIVAQGTGYNGIAGNKILAQNYNPLKVEIGKNYKNVSISVDEISRGNGAQVYYDSETSKYYLYTGKTKENKGVKAGETITITLTAKQDVGGFEYRATRVIYFDVVDFYVTTVRADEVMPTTKRFAFVNGKKYNLNLFGNIDDLSSIKVITFDQENEETTKAVQNFIDEINGKVEGAGYNGWSRQTTESDGRLVFVSLVPQEEESENWIDGNYQFLKFDSTGYKILSSGISTGNILNFELVFHYESGVFTLGSKEDYTNFTKRTENIDMQFYQVTSQEHPQPVYTLNQFMSMEADIDYILMNNLQINDEWTPLNVAVKSFNGNGFNIEFNPTSISPSDSSDVNYGLFGTIDSASVIKNVRIVLGESGLALNDDEKSKTSLNFGVLAGTNNGSVYNCSVYGLTNQKASKVIVDSPTSNNANYNVAGLVAVNVGGISNSRVEYVNIDAGGYVAGLVVENSGVIAGSYYTGGKITNNSESSEYVTAGFIVNNLSGGIINSSFVGGTYTTTSDNGVTSLDTSEKVESIRDASISSTVTSAGFVYENSGSISDCYSAVAILSNKMSGFAFINYGSGKISKCYSTCDLSSTATIAEGYPFIGLDNLNASVNNNYNKTDGIVNCFYYDSGFAVQSTRLEEAKALSVEDFCGNNGTTPFKDFIFSTDRDKDNAEFTGVWVFVNKDNLYFTPERFKTKLSIGESSSDDNIGYTNFGPKLVSASLIATPKMTLEKTEQKSTGEIVYTYGISYSQYFTKVDNSDYGTDYCYDPVVVSNMEQFNNAFTLSEDEDSDTVIINDIRIINHLTQSDLNVNESLQSPYVKYAGILSGNGFTFNNVALALNSTTNSDNIEYYGLIGKLTTKTLDGVNYIGTIKNYNITISNIDSSTVAYVGGLVGRVENANLYDINVTNRYGRVVGYNFVGGIAGYVTGTSRIHTAYSNVGVTANYRADTENLYNSDLINAYGLSANKIFDNKTLGYAGGLFGVVDITQFDSKNPSSSDTSEARVYNIKGDSSVVIVGKIVGGLIGCVGEYTVVHKATKIVEQGAILRGYVFAGGVVGQNNGFIKYANVTYTDKVQAEVDSAITGADSTGYLGLFDSGASPLAIGGVVGLNIGSSNLNWPGGSIQLSSSKVAVRNSNAGNAGGIAGAVYGGDIRACFATGSVLASKTAYVGGIIGYLSDFSAEAGILSGMGNPFGKSQSCGTTIDYVVAMNNYQASDFNYYKTLRENYGNNIEGAIGGIVGYVYHVSLLYTTHTVQNGLDDKYAYLTNPTNYFVSQILGQTTNSIQPVKSGKFINLYEVNEETGREEINLAVGLYGTTDSIILGTGLTRPYMLNHTDEIFAGWDIYSLDDSSGIPNIQELDIPDEFDVDSIEDLKIMYWHPEKNYRLVGDIDFAEIVDGETKIQSAFFAIGSESAPFTGTFTSKAKSDGSLPKISNMFIINSSASSLGFFGAIKNATIENIMLENIHYSTMLNKNSRSSVGGLAGVVTDSTVTNVSITISDNAIDPGIFTNANVVGGMFGKICTSNGETIIDSCYVENNLVLTDNIYANKTNVTLGGFAGQIEGDTIIKGAMATGKMRITYTDMSKEKFNESKAGEITHIIGGFAGQISGNVTESACVTAVDVTLDNVLSTTKAGGFVGVIKDTELKKVDSHANITVNMAGIEDDMYVGGLVGEVTTKSDIKGFVVAGDITLNGTFKGNGTSHYVAGIVANMNAKTTIGGGYSLASIKNNTTFTNIDMDFGVGDTSSVGYQGAVLVDKFYALTNNDKANVGADNSIGVKSGGGLEPTITTEKLFIQDNPYQYYRIDYRTNKAESKTDTQNTLFNDTYKAMYTLNSGLYKTAPILISTTTIYNGVTSISAPFSTIKNSEDYLYYLQSEDITLTSANKLYGSELTDFYGSYNGGGKTISLPTHFDMNVGSENCGLFGHIKESSMILGVVIKEVNVYASLTLDVENFGIIAGVADKNTYIANCYIAGEVSLNVAGSTNIGGFVGSSGANYVGCVTDLVVNLSGDGAYKYGALFGVVNSNITNYMLVDTYSAGKVNNTGTNSNAMVAGMIADSSMSNLFARNCYTMTEINSNIGATANVVCATSPNVSSNGIYYDSNNAVNKNADNQWTSYTYRELTASELGDNYKVDMSKNYGMPVLAWTSGFVAKTGSGKTSDPYIINTATQFAWMIKNAQSGVCYALNSELDYTLINATIEYKNSKNFAGFLNGQYHYITNSSGVLFGTIKGGVTKLGFKSVNTSGTILADSVESGANVGEIYVESTLGSVVGSGAINNCASTGATFNESATHCYNISSITDEIYSTLDHSIWTYNGRDYMLAGFIKNCATAVQLTNTFVTSGTTITVSNKQDFFNALWYAKANNGNKYEILATFDTLDLNGLCLEVPSNITAIKGSISTIKNGTFTNSSIAKFDTNTLTIDNCGLIADKENGAILGSTSNKYSKITIQNSKIVANKSGGTIFDTIDNAIDLTIKHSSIIVGVLDADLVANSVSSTATGYKVTISNVKVYGEKLRSIINENGASGTITVDMASGSEIDNIVNSNTSEITVDLSSGTLSKPVVNTNGSGGVITITGANATINGNVVATNEAGGTIKIALNSGTISHTIADTNAGDIEITLNGDNNNSISANPVVATNTGTIAITTENATISGKLVATNLGTITANLTNTNISGTLVENNSGTIKDTTITGGTISQLVGANNTNGSVTATITNSKVDDIVNENAGIVNVTLTSDKNNIIYTLVNTNEAGGSVTASISGSTINKLTDTNAGVLDITIKDNSTISGLLVAGNNGTAKFDVSGGTINNALITTNSGTAEIEVQGSEISSDLITTNQGTSTTINVSDLRVLHTLINENSQTITITVGSNVTLNSALVNINNHESTVNVNGVDDEVEKSGLITTNNGKLFVNGSEYTPPTPETEPGESEGE